LRTPTSSWAAMCPGNHESGGKRKSGKTRKGKQRAAIAVGHSIVEAIYFILRDGVVYQELGPEYFDKIDKDHIIRHYKKRLEALGLLVEVSEAPVAA